MSLFNVDEVMKLLGTILLVNFISALFVFVRKTPGYGVVLLSYLGGRAISASLLATDFELCMIMDYFIHKLSLLPSNLSHSGKVCHLSGLYYRTKIKEKRFSKKMMPKQ